MRITAASSGIAPTADGSFAEQPRCRRLGTGAGERRDGPDVLAVDREPLAARGEDARRGTAGEDALDRGGDAVDDVLGVVEHDQHVEGADLGQDLGCGTSVGGEAERRHHDVGDGGGILDRCELDDAGAELAALRSLGGRPRGRAGSCRRRPGPVRVTSRAWSSSSTMRSVSSSRPTNDDGTTGGRNRRDAVRASVAALGARPWCRVTAERDALGVAQPRRGFETGLGQRVGRPLERPQCLGGSGARRRGPRSAPPNRPRAAARR